MSDVFIPRYEVTKDSGRKMIVTRVNTIIALLFDSALREMDWWARKLAVSACSCNSSKSSIRCSTLSSIRSMTLTLRLRTP